METALLLIALNVAFQFNVIRAQRSMDRKEYGLAVGAALQSLLFLGIIILVVAA